MMRNLHQCEIGKLPVDVGEAHMHLLPPFLKAIEAECRTTGRGLEGLPKPLEGRGREFGDPTSAETTEIRGLLPSVLPSSKEFWLTN